MSPKLKICLVSSYVPKHFGGGEVYFFSVAEYLSKFYDVTVGVPVLEPLTDEDVKNIRTAYQLALDKDLSQVAFVQTPLLTSANFFFKLFWTKQFDVMYYVTDGSLFFSLAKRNILHIQLPYTHPMRSLLSRFKLRNWKVKNANSKFTKEVIERAWDVKVPFVHYPFVDAELYKPAKRKDKVILHVGRFFTQLHAKQQDILVKAFSQMVDEHPQVMKDWKLVLIGRVEDQAFADKVAKMAEGYPIEILHDVDQTEIRKWYARAKMYWHATGYGVDEYINPEQMEHFGISTLEAMASGAIPIVINQGGQPELVDPGVNGFLWNELDALKEKTLACIQETVETKFLAEHAREKAEQFNSAQFYQTLNEMIGVSQPVIIEENPGVSAVIPNYNGLKLLKKHLPHVFAMLKDQDEVVIVDDASTDDAVAWLIETYKLKKRTDRAEFVPELYEGVHDYADKSIYFKLLVHLQNERFAATSNHGVSEAKHPLLFLVNNDVRPHHDIRQYLVKHFVTKKNGQTRNVFAVGCLEKEEIEGGKFVQGGKNRLWFERGLFAHSRAREFTDGETGWASGGSAMFDRQKWEALNGFDLAYRPAYWEDIDLSFRARQKGWSVLFEHNAVVDHNHETTNQDAFGQKKIQIMSIKNNLLFTWKNGTPLQRLQMLFWLPYHVLITNKRTQGAFNLGLIFWLRTTLFSKTE